MAYDNLSLMIFCVADHWLWLKHPRKDFQDEPVLVKFVCGEMSSLEILKCFWDVFCEVSLVGPWDQ